MLFNKVFIAVCAVASICAALTLNIRGTVKNKAGAAIPGAAVKLETYKLAATTGPDGGFTLTGTITGIHPNNNPNSLSQSPITLHQGQIRFSLSEKASVAISVRNVGGGQIFKSQDFYDAGTHILPAHSSQAGIHLYQVTIGQNNYTFLSSPLGSFSGELQSVSGGTSKRFLSKQAKASAAVFKDVITVAMQGYLNYRDLVMKPDTAGMVITMIPNAGNATDVDGNVYQSVQIGSQVWTTENLKTTKYNDGTPIPHVTDNAVWDSLKTGAYCLYNNDPANKKLYGALYHWFAVRTGKLAPAGWRVPTDADWDTLLTYLSANGYNWDGTTKGNKVAKSLASKTDWAFSEKAGAPGNNPSTNNTTGFSGFPGGRRTFATENIRFVAKDSTAYWWSATVEMPDNTKAWNYVLKYFGGRLYTSVHYYEYALSVRLIRNN